MVHESHGSPVSGDVDTSLVWHQWYEPEVPFDVDVPSIPLDELLARTAARYPEREAIYFMGAGITYRQLDELVSQFANGLVRLGVRPGDQVAFLLPNCPQFIIAYYGGIRAGAVMCPANPTYVEVELRAQFADAGAKCVV